MCSILGDAIERIASAIDQVANDARGPASERELTERVADLWLMMGSLDPELARRRQAYTTMTDSAPR